MAPFGIFKSGKKPVAKPGKPVESSLVNKVEELSSRGLSEPEIFKALRREGHGSLEIDKAIRHSVKAGLGLPRKVDSIEDIPENLPRDFPKIPDLPSAKDKIELTPPPGSKPLEHELEKTEFPESHEFQEHEAEPFREESRRPPHVPPPRRLRPSLPEQQQPREHISRKEVEELIEAVVGEKWKNFEGRLKDLDNIFKDVDSKLRSLDIRLDKMREERVGEVDKLGQKLDVYKDSLVDMTSKMEGMQSAMKQSLSPLMETLRSLSDTIQTLKEYHKKEKKIQ